MKTHTTFALRFGIVMLMIFVWAMPLLATSLPTPDGFRSTSPYKLEATGLEATYQGNKNFGNKTYTSTIYDPFGNQTPSSGGGGNPANNDGNGSGEDVGIPDWADTPSEPLPIADGTLFLLLVVATMITIIAIKQRKQKQLQSITTNNNNNTTTRMTTRKQTYPSFFQKLFLLLAFVCIAGQVSADRTIYFRPSTVSITGGNGYDASSWYHYSSDDYSAYIMESYKTEWANNYYSITTNRDYRPQLTRHDHFKSSSTFPYIQYTLPDDYTRIAVYRWKSTSYQFGDYKNTRQPTRIVYSIPKGEEGKFPSSAPIEVPDGVAYNEAPATLNLLVAQEGKINSSDYYWAHLTPANSPVEIYFADINKWSTGTEDPIQLLTGKDIFTRCTSLERIQDTRLWYKTFATEDRAFAYKFYGFVGNMNWWSGDLTIHTLQPHTVSSEKAEGNKIATWIAKATTSTTLLQDTPLGVDATTGISLFTPGSANKNSTLNKETITTWETLNHTQTVIVETGGKLNYKAAYLTGKNTSTFPDETNLTGTISFTAAYTGSVILRAKPDDGYYFLGFFDEATGELLTRGEKMTDELGGYVYRYQAPNAPKTIRARFTAQANIISKKVRMQLWSDSDSKYADWTSTPSGNSFTINYTDVTTGTEQEYTFDKPLSENLSAWICIDAADKDYIRFNNIDPKKSITLTANTVTNYTFVGWWNNNSGQFLDNPWEIPSNNDEGVTARIAPADKIKQQTIKIEGEGQVNINYFFSHSAENVRNLTFDQNSSFNAWAGSEVTLTANPLAGYKLDGWYEGGNKITTGVSGNTLTYAATSARTITAKFVSTINQLTVSVLNYDTKYNEFREYEYEYNKITLTGGGKSLESFSSFSCEFDNATTVTLTATPEDGEDGYDFIGWYQNGERISPDATINVDVIGLQAISAHFAPKKCHHVQLQALMGGTYSVKYARADLFDKPGMYYVVQSEYANIVDIFVPYDAKIAVINPKPIHGYQFKKEEELEEGFRVWEGKDLPPQVQPNFVRTEEQVVYLDISNKNQDDSDWKNVLALACNMAKPAKPKLNQKREDFTKVDGFDNIYKITIPANTYDHITISDAAKQPVHSTTPLAIPSTRYNCFKLNAYRSSTGEWVDAWTTLPAQEGDFRLVYIEQTVVDKHTIREDYRFDKAEAIKPRTSAGTDILSLHIYNKVSEDGKIDGMNNPEILLQKRIKVNGAFEWQTIERRMVFGPLRATDEDVIRMPGRRNAAAVVYDNGIDNIKNNDQDNGSGVWNFVIKQDGNGNATILAEQTLRYTGDYYIRTTNADGQYNNYTHPGNIMTYSKYAADHRTHTGYTDYFIRYVDINEDGTPTAEAGKHPLVKFAIANDYAIYLNHELMINNDRFKDDEYEDDPFVVNKDGAPNLPADASVRFGWDRVTNRLTRAYIANTTIKNNEYLVVDGTNIGNPSGDNKYFTDNSNWLYTIDLNATKNATANVKAKMNGQYQYFMGSEGKNETLISGNGANTYPIRLLYDFKDDRFTTIYRPDAALSGTVNLETPVMIEREHNNAPTQIQFNQGAEITVNGDFDKPAYAVMTFLEEKLASKDITHHEKMFYWVSFPFDVKISDVFGLGKYGKYWIMQRYDGAQRAASGLAQNNWKYITNTGYTLDKNVGYVICLNYNQILQDELFKSYGSNWSTLGKGKLSLYFPSKDVINPKDISLQTDPVVVELEAWEAGENIAWNHLNWHIIGVPSFADPTFSTTQGDVPFFYQYWHPTDGYAAVASTKVDFYAMHSYMVQYAGYIKWNSVINTTPQSLAARRDAAAEDKPIMLRLELQQAGSTIDRTFVQLRSDKGTLGFDLNLDLSKIINAGSNIYSVVSGDQMAGNAIPKEETVLPIGVVTSAAGEYTFSMPEGTEGMLVELIDYEQGTSINLLMSDYTVTLPKGTLDQRFALRLKPDKVATSVDNIGNEASGNETVRKLLIDGMLYMQRGNITYDAQGRIVFER